MVHPGQIGGPKGAVDWHQATAIPGPGAPKTDAARKGRDTGSLQDAWFTLARLSAIVVRSFQLFLSGSVSTPPVMRDNAKGLPK
jgi:hypothetical protein